MQLRNEIILKNVISLFHFLQYHSNVIIQLISSRLMEKSLQKIIPFWFIFIERLKKFSQMIESEKIIFES